MCSECALAEYSIGLAGASVSLFYSFCLRVRMDVPETAIPTQNVLPSVASENYSTKQLKPVEEGKVA